MTLTRIPTLETQVRDRWQGKIILKGIMDPEDAVQACNRGVDAIVVSNHGGRQLDGTWCSSAKRENL